MKITTRTTAVPVQELSLPSAPTPPRESLRDYLLLIYGQVKIGKTSLAAQFPEALFFLFEPGGKALSIYERQPKSWEEFQKYVTLVKKDKRFNTIVIDTADLAIKACRDYVCKEMGIDHPSDEDFGKAWEAIRDEFTRQILGLVKTGKGIIFISHSVEKEIKKRITSIHRVVPTMSSQARAVLEPMVDIWAYMTYNDEGERELVIRGNDYISAGHRLQKHFQGYDSVPMGKSAEEAYQNLLDAFDNKPTKKSKNVIVRR